MAMNMILTLLLRPLEAAAGTTPPPSCFPLSVTLGDGTGYLLQRGTLGGAALFLEEHSWCADGSEGVPPLPVASRDHGIEGVYAVLRAYQDAYPERPTYTATLVEGGILVAPTGGPRLMDQPADVAGAPTVLDGERSVVQKFRLRTAGGSLSDAHGCGQKPGVGREGGSLLQVLRAVNAPCQGVVNPNPVGFYLLVDPVFDTVDYGWLVDRYFEPNPGFPVIGLEGVTRVGELLPGVKVPASDDPLVLELLQQLEREEQEKAATAQPTP